LDFKDEGTTTMIDFFDHVCQPRSEFGLWLFDGARVDAESMTFSEYISMVAYASILSKQDLSRLMFNSSAKDSLSLTKNDWRFFVETMLSVEKVHHPRRTAIEAFDRFTSKNVHGESVIHFEDFTKITQQFPFLRMPFSRLLTHLRKHHLGENFWRLKRQEIHNTYATISEKEEVQRRRP
jgi:hypothetical protein